MPAIATQQLPACQAAAAAGNDGGIPSWSDLLTSGCCSRTAERAAPDRPAPRSGTDWDWLLLPPAALAFDPTTPRKSSTSTAPKAAVLPHRPSLLGARGLSSFSCPPHAPLLVPAEPWDGWRRLRLWAVAARTWCAPSSTGGVQRAALEEAAGHSQHQRAASWGLGRQTARRRAALPLVLRG